MPRAPVAPPPRACERRRADKGAEAWAPPAKAQGRGCGSRAEEARPWSPRAIYSRRGGARAASQVLARAREPDGCAAGVQSAAGAQGAARAASHTRRALRSRGHVCAMVSCSGRGLGVRRRAIFLRGVEVAARQTARGACQRTIIAAREAVYSFALVFRELEGYRSVYVD